MDPQILEALLKAHLSEKRQRLDLAAGNAKDAVDCADAGDVEKAVEIALDVEQLVCEVNTFLNAASLMHRIYRS
jgi:hypothetical protein